MSKVETILSEQKELRAKDQTLFNQVSQARDNLLARKSFLEGYLSQNNTLAGADAAWNQYLTDNPIFDPTVDEMRLNPNRITYEQYFSQGGATPDFTVRKKR